MDSHTVNNELINPLPSISTLALTLAWHNVSTAGQSNQFGGTVGAQLPGFLTVAPVLSPKQKDQNLERIIHFDFHPSTLRNGAESYMLTLASVTLNSLKMYWGMLYSAIGSTTKYWYLADLSAGQYW